MPINRKEPIPMITMKKFTALLLSLMLLIPFTACNDAEGSSSATDSVSDTTEENSAADDADTDDSTSQAANLMQPDIPATYDSDDISDECADLICTYFKAIANQDYETYKSTLNKDYFQVYNSWLVATYSYGMESSFEMQHEVLMDTAGAKDSVIITGLELKSVEDTGPVGNYDSRVDSFLGDYDSIVGEGFADTIRNSCDEILDVSFNMKGICDGGEEQDIMTGMEMLVTVKDGKYSLLG